MKAKLIRGAFFVTGATLFVKILSIVYKIPYQNITGDKGFYIYQQMVPFYALIVLAGSFAIPLAVSEAIQRIKKTSTIVSSLFYPLLGFGILCSIGIIIGNQSLASWMNDERLSPLFYPLILVFSFVPFVSVMRGTKNADVRTLNHVGYSLILEQGIRVIVIIGVLVFFTHGAFNDLYQVAKYSYFGYGIGLAFACVFLMFSFQFRNLSFRAIDLKQTRILVKRAFFLLVTSSMLILMQLVDSLTIINQLSLSMNTEEAMILKGIYDRALPLIQTAVFFVSPLLASVIPHLKSPQDQKKLIQLIIIMAFPITFGLLFIEPVVNQLLFQNQEGNSYIQISLLVILFYSLFLTFSALTKRSTLLLWDILIGIVLKFGINYILIPIYGIIGASISSFIAFVVMVFILIWKTRNEIKIPLIFLLKVMLSTSGMMITLFLSKQLGFLPHLWIKIFIGVISFMAMTFIFRIKVDDLLIKEENHA